MPYFYRLGKLAESPCLSLNKSLTSREKFCFEILLIFCRFSALKFRDFALPWLSTPKAFFGSHISKWCSALFRVFQEGKQRDLYDIKLSTMGQWMWSLEMIKPKWSQSRRVGKKTSTERELEGGSNSKVFLWTLNHCKCTLCGSSSTSWVNLVVDPSQFLLLLVLFHYYRPTL